MLGDRLPGVEDMKKLKYTTRVINEVFFLHLQFLNVDRGSRNNAKCVQSFSFVKPAKNNEGKFSLVLYNTNTLTF